MSGTAASNEGTRLKQAILEDGPRLDPDSRFRFRCHLESPCFTACCADVNIFLTPYDVLRMKNRLGISSQEFLARYTVSPFTEKQKLPVVVLKMEDDQGKRCPFVSPEGCRIYQDRPWPCRMYPVGKASSADDEFYFLLEEEGCEGFCDDREWTVAEWMANQGVAEYDEIGELFSAIVTSARIHQGAKLNPQQMEMFYMACYDLDKFRRFVLESRFLDLHDVAEETVERIKTDDLALLRFAFDWLRFWLSGVRTMKIKEDVAETKRQQLGLAN